MSESFQYEASRSPEPEHRHDLALKVLSVKEPKTRFHKYNLVDAMSSELNNFSYNTMHTDISNFK